MCLSWRTQFKARTDAVWMLYQVCIHTHSRGGNDITGFSAMDSLITTLNKQFIKAGFLGSVPAPPHRSSLSCSLLNALKAGILESIAKHRQVKPCGDEESEEERFGKKNTFLVDAGIVYDPGISGVLWI